MKHILIGTDGSPDAAAAVTEGVELAKLLGAHVTFVTVRSGSALLGEPFYGEHPSEQLARARAALDAAKAEAQGLGVPAETELLEGHPADSILHLADSRKADLIVVGSRGLGAIAGALLGSISRRLVQHSPIPVLVVKKRAAGEQRDSAAA